MSNGGHEVSKSRWFNKPRLVTAFAVLFLSSLSVLTPSCGDAVEDDAEVDNPSQGHLSRVVLRDVRDTRIGELAPNRNHGLSRYLSVSSGGRERSLIAFDEETIRRASRSGSIRSATVEFTIDNAASNFAAGGTVSLYEVTTPWTEWGASWMCANEARSGDSADCREAWSMDGTDVDWAPIPIASVVIANGQTGTLAFDVSDTIAAILAGGKTQGWILIRDDEASGSAEGDNARENTEPGVGPGDNSRPDNNVDKSQCANGDASDGIPALCYSEPWDLPPSSDLVIRSGENADGPRLILEVESDIAFLVEPPTYIGSANVNADNQLSEVSPNANLGSLGELFVSGLAGSTDRNYSIVKVDETDITAVIGRNRLGKAELSFVVDPNIPSSVTSTISIHRVLTSWNEVSSSWSCRDETPLGSCAMFSVWDMFTGAGTYELGWITKKTITNENEPLILDVTADVQRILDGGSNHGWLLKSNASNGASLHSREATIPSNRPVLKLYGACDPATYQQQSTSCGLGACAGNVGTLICKSGVEVDSCDPFSGAATYDVTCDGVDDDCDGLKDEDGAPISCSAPPEVVPSPETVATELGAGEPPFADSVAFLWEEDPAVQRGVDPTIFEDYRLAVLRGRVLDVAEQPLEGVRITIHGRPEFGYTYTRVDGAFDIAVNGGEALNVGYSKAGSLPVQRQTQVPWEDFVVMEDVVMTALDSNSTSITSNSSSWQVARGSLQSDTDGSRQATVLFPEGTSATMIHSDGFTEELLTSLNVRATEYTVGPTGPRAMPGTLPPQSAYTYAVEMSVDEALLTGAVRVEFSNELPFYVENFLGFPVGGIVPAGYYDRDLAAWVASKNGLIVDVRGIDSKGKAMLDVDGDQVVETAATLLSDYGITADELKKLGEVYAAPYSLPQSMWRVPIDHFTPWDYNWPFGPPFDADAPPDESPRLANEFDPDSQDSDCEWGCSIEAQRQVLGETIPIAGTSLSLNYRSNRQLGYKASQTVEIPLSGAIIPPSLESIEVSVHIAGRRIKQSFAPQANLSHTFVWDGLDAFGRRPPNASAIIVVGYEYVPVYYDAQGAFLNSFGQASAKADKPAAVIGQRASQTIRLERRHLKELSQPVAGAELGGWSLSARHALERNTGTLRLGTGGEQQFETDVLDVFAGFGPVGSAGDGGPATEATLSLPRGLALTANGELLIADSANNRIRKVARDGTISTVAGTGVASNTGDGGPAIQASIAVPQGVAVGPDGSIYVSSGPFVRRIDPNGIITRFAGNGSNAWSFGGILATDASLAYPMGLAVSADGLVYIAESSHNRIRRVDRNGIIETFAGTGDGPGSPYAEEGVPAIKTTVYQPYDVAVGPDGTVYIAKFSAIVKVGSDGIIHNVTVEHAHTGIRTVDVDETGRVYFTSNQNLWRENDDGAFESVATFGAPTSFGLAVGHGNQYVSDFVTQESRVWQRQDNISPIVDGNSVPSLNGGHLYEFNSSGVHQRTTHALTEADLVTFGYDANVELTTITDADGNVVTVERDPSSGQLTGILSADGQRTVLSVNSDGYLESATNPAGDVYQMSYEPNGSGLMTQFTDPNLNATTFGYDSLGRFISDLNAEGGGWTVTRVDEENGYSVTMTTAEGRASEYEVLVQSDDSRTLVTRGPDGAEVRRVKVGETTTLTTSDGTIASFTQAADPRFGMLVPIVESEVVTLPVSGLTATTTTSRGVSEDTNGALATHTTTTTVNGRVFTKDYDAATQTVTFTTPEGRTFTGTVDSVGRPLTAFMPGLETKTYSYDSRGRIETVTVGTGSNARTNSATYYVSGPEQGAVQSLTDAESSQATFSYDISGHAVTSIMPGSLSVQTISDGNGNITSLDPPGQPAHIFTYDGVNLPEEYTPPTLASVLDPKTSHQYNLDRQLERTDFPNGDFIDPLYLSNGRLDSIQSSDGTYVLAYQTVPNSGYLESITAPSGDSVTYSHDGPLLTNEAWSGPFADSVTGNVAYQYDSNFWIDTVDIDGLVVDYNFDDDGLLVQAGLLSLVRNPLHGGLDSTSLGVVSVTIGVNTYDAAVSGVSIYNLSVVTDDIGRITQKTETVQGVTSVYDYTYEASGVLDTVTRDGVQLIDYGYDDNGNRKFENSIDVASHDDQDRLLSYENVNYAYSDRGQLQTKVEVPSGATTAFDYDVFGKLKQVTMPGGAIVDYVQDAGGRRVGKKVNGSFLQGFLYQGAMPVAELGAAGTVVARFVYGPAGNVPTYMEKSGSTYQIISDHLGSPRLVVDTVSGTIAQRLDYDEWGQVTGDTNPGFQPFGFAGGLLDSDTGLVRFGARDYDPTIGRWTDKDPIGFAGGDTNLYAYVGNDPINYLDPSGHLAIGYDSYSDYLIDKYTLVGVYKTIDHHFGQSGLDAVTNFSAGFGDEFLSVGPVGFGPYLRGKAGVDDIVDPCALAYMWGGISGQGALLFLSLKQMFGQCFAAGTLVETVNGLVAIEDIKVGDLVWSRDEDTGEEGWKPVVELFVTPNQALLDLDLVEADDDEQELLVTAEHPLRTMDGWTLVSELEVDDVVWGRDGWAEVASLRTSGRRETVYNFEVADFHSYFVGEAGVWAHNTCSGFASPQDLMPTHAFTRSRRGMRRLYDDIARNGMQDSIKYVEHNGVKYVVDGNHRLGVAKGLGLDKVPVEQVELPYGGYRNTNDLSFSYE